MFTAPAALATAEFHVGLNVLADMCRHAKSTFPRECCGVVKGRFVRDRVVFFETLPAENTAPPEEHDCFHMDWLTLLHGLRHVDAGTAHRIAFYHSHPNGGCAPSDVDMKNSWPGVPVFIIPVILGQVQRPVLWLPPG